MTFSRFTNKEIKGQRGYLNCKWQSPYLKPDTSQRVCAYHFTMYHPPFDLRCRLNLIKNDILVNYSHGLVDWREYVHEKIIGNIIKSRKKNIIA